jgi:sarcosine oxidase, subunit delta
MQLFKCPFCGPRDETEFVFGAEAGKQRPEPAGQVSDADWSRYLHLNANRKGASREIWLHVTCGEFFVMERDTITHAVSASHAIRGVGE